MKAKIYVLKNKGKVRYIGKSIKENKNGVLNKSHLSRLYNNEKTRKIVSHNKNSSIEVIDEVKVENWYDKKIDHIVDYHINKHALLLNSQFMKEGKRGYWQGKKRDKNTLQKLSQSKFKPVLQYDKSGNLIKIWKSGKDVAIHVFKDYKVINGSAESAIYNILQSKTIQARFKKGYYWFKKDELGKNKVPIRININQIKENQKKQRTEKNKQTKIKNGTYGKSGYSVKPIVQYDLNRKKINEFKSVTDASQKTGISKKIIGRFCTHKTLQTNVDGYIFEFKEKKHKDKYINNLKEKNEKLEAKKNKLKKKYYIPILRRKVVAYKENGQEYKKFNTATLAANHFNLKGRDIVKFIENNESYLTFKFNYLNEN